MKKFKFLSLFLAILLLNVHTLHAAYFQRERRITPSLYLIGSIQATDTGASYTDGSSPKLFLRGTSSLTITDQSTHINRYGSGYVMYYRAQLQGEINRRFKSEFSQAGFSIGVEEHNKVYVSKYVTGTFYFTKGWNNECTREGLCKWNITPIPLELEK